MKLLISVYLIFYCNCVFSQIERLPISSYKHKNTERVLQDIALAFGSPYPVPDLVIFSKDNVSKKIARFKPDPVPTISIDENLYDLCASLKADSLNALACILGHELAHYYRQHPWTDGFIEITGQSSGKKTIAKELKEKLEAEADHLGMFYGFVAGYNTLEVMPDIMKKIYETYALPSVIEGYLSIEERIGIATENAVALQPFAYAFEAGEFLYLKKYYAEAAECFQYVSQHFPSQEMYNNLGVALLAQAAQLMGNDDMYFAYPFELDAQNRLMNGTTRSYSDKDHEKAYQLLEKASIHLEKAKIVDRSYTPPYINLASTQSLMGNQEIAIGIINELERICKKEKRALPGNAHLIRGIALVKSQRVLQAEYDFIQMREKNAYMYAYNYDLYRQFNASWVEVMMDAMNAWIQQYFFQNSKDSTNRVLLREQNTGTIQLANMEKLPFSTLSVLNATDHPVRIDYLPSKEGLTLKIKLKTSTFYLHQAKYDEGHATGKKALVGWPVQKLMNHYGQPSSITHGAANMQLYLYDQANIIFKIKDEQISGWKIYKASVF